MKCNNCGAPTGLCGGCGGMSRTRRYMVVATCEDWEDGRCFSETESEWVTAETPRDAIRASVYCANYFVVHDEDGEVVFDTRAR